MEKVARLVIRDSGGKQVERVVGYRARKQTTRRSHREGVSREMMSKVTWRERRLGMRETKGTF